MRFQNIFFTAISALALLSNGCKSDVPVNSANTNAVNRAANVSSTNTDNPLETSKTPEAATTNNAPTLAPVVRAYYDALKKRDDAALRKVYAADTLKSLQADMKEEKKTSLVEFLTELEPAPDQPFEVRNEQIQGNTAIAEMRGGSYPNGIKVKFIKENGEWKLTNESPELDAVRQSSGNSNQSK